ncbi:MAG: hypothetical protein Q8P12_06455 [bacterium]|nr:hypothetical protein [bacterium]
MTFPLFVFALDREIFAGEAESLTVPSSEGELQVLAQHTPVISQLTEGDLLIRKEDGTEQKLPISGGVLKVKEKEVIVLANL